MVTVPRRAAEERGERGPFFPAGDGNAVKNIFPSKPRLSHNEKTVADTVIFLGCCEKVKYKLQNIKKNF